MTLAGIKEIADEFAVSRTAVNHWAKQPNFPQPVANLSTGRVWNLDEVRAWRSTAKTKPGPAPGTPRKVKTRDDT